MIKKIIQLTLLIESITIFFRYVLKMESTRDTKKIISPYTFGIRIHHGYIGLLILYLLRISKYENKTIKIIAFSLFLSDLIHHFIVLKKIKGSPEFDLIYSNKGL